MKIILISFILLIFTSIEAKAQDCKDSCRYYVDFVKKAEENTVKTTQEKLNYYRAAIIAAKDCNCPELEKEVNGKIDDLYKDKENAEKAAAAAAKTEVAIYKLNEATFEQLEQLFQDFKIYEKIGATEAIKNKAADINTKISILNPEFIDSVKTQQFIEDFGQNPAFEAAIDSFKAKKNQ